MKRPTRRARSPASAGASDVTRGGTWDTVLTALTVALGAQVVRVLFPLAYGFGETTSFMKAGALALAVSLAPLLAAPVVRALGPAVSLTVSVGALLLLRFATQVVRPIPLWLAAAGTAVALVAWTVQFLRAAGRGSDCFVIGLIAGLALDVSVRSGFWTWDYAWQDGPGPLISCLVVTAVALVSLIRASSDNSRLPALRGVAFACALGPWLMLQFLIFQSPAFVASATGLSVPAASIVILVQDAVALGLVAWVRVHPPPYPATLVAGAALMGLTFSFTWVDEPVVVGALLAGGPLAGGLLLVSLSRIHAAEAPASLWPPAAALGAGTFLFFALVLLYQIHYDMPLPVPNSLLFQLAAALLTLGAMGPRAPAALQSWESRAPAAPLALAVIPGIALLASSEPGVRASVDTLRLVNYNIHSAVNGEGQLDPEGIARVIQAQRPDVVTLQEVSRGWAIAGTTDLAEWLSHRLHMRYVYAPAADGQFGNVVLSRLPIVASEGVYLPKGAGPMRRSYARAEVDLGNGQSVDVISVHLQHREQNTNTRLTQIAVLIETWRRERPAVLAGDLNAEPGSPEVAEFENLGLVSAQDVTGHEELVTSPSQAPRVRIDWIFGTSDVGFAEFSIPRTTASDHLPLAVDVTIRR